MSFMSAKNSSGEAMMPSSMRLLTVLYRSHAGKERWARSEKSLVKQVGCAVQQVHVQEGAACHVDSEASSAPGSLCQTPPAGGIAQHHAPEVHRPRDDGVVVRQPQFDSVDWFRKDPRLLQTRKRTRDPCRA